MNELVRDRRRRCTIEYITILTSYFISAAGWVGHRTPSIKLEMPKIHDSSVLMIACGLRSILRSVRYLENCMHSGARASAEILRSNQQRSCREVETMATFDTTTCTVQCAHPSAIGNILTSTNAATRAFRRHVLFGKRSLKHTSVQMLWPPAHVRPLC
jgi:hypothetical protein